MGSDLLGESRDILPVGPLSNLRGSLSGKPPLRFIVEALSLRAFERLGFHKHTLTFVPAPSTAESDDNRRKR